VPKPYPHHISRLALCAGLAASVTSGVQAAEFEVELLDLARAACVGLGTDDTCEIGYKARAFDGSCRTWQGIVDGDLFCLPPGIGSALSYPVVDTGQSGCYADHGAEIACPVAGDALSGQDAQHQGHAAVRIDRGDGTIVDLVTGLTWQQSSDTNDDGVINLSDELTFDEAASYCDALELGGYRDWRLPDIKTLYSLIDFDGVDPNAESTDTDGLRPFIDDSLFAFAYGDLEAGERIIDAQYASSTLYSSPIANSGSTLFGVNFADGRIKGYGLSLRGQDKTFSVLCVRGNPDYGLNAFVDNADGTITDRATGLMWTQADSGVFRPEGLDWREALELVQAANAIVYLGYSDWRLPNAKELQSLIDYDRAPDTTDSGAIDPLFDASAIINEAGQLDFANAWTSTTHVNAGPVPGGYGVYLTFGRGLGYINGAWVDVHGAGAQRSDPKRGDPADYPTGHGPQGDAIRIYNDVRLVRDAGFDG
jgi:hypothetical protein